MLEEERVEALICRVSLRPLLQHRACKIVNFHVRSFNLMLMQCKQNQNICALER